MRYLVLLLVVLAVAAPATAAPIAPCKLVTLADARATLGVFVGKPRSETIGFYQSCTYRHGTSFLIVETRAISKTAFVKSAKLSVRPVVAVSGLGVPAYSAAGTVLLVWRHGTEATFLVTGPGKGLPDAERLAKRVLGRL
jgi:hypothetical protein